MNRETIVEFHKKGLLLCQYNIFRYTQSEFDNLTKTIYKSRGDAYKAIDEFIEFWNKDTINNNRYFKDKYTISFEDFTIRDCSEDWDP